MANTKSAKKRARQTIFKRKKNLARKSALKTAVKKVLESVKIGDHENSIAFFKDAQAKISRAKNKHVLHKNTAARKIGRLAKKVAALAKQQSQASVSK